MTDCLINIYHQQILKISCKNHYNAASIFTRENVDIMTVYQSSIFEPLPKHSRYLAFAQKRDSDQSILKALLANLTIENMVVGLGHGLMSKLNLEIPGMKEMPEFKCRDEPLPRQPNDLRIWLKGDNPGDLLHRSQQLIERLSNCLVLDTCSDGFLYSDGRDLT
ncbi:MAG: putative iron-dependent peroxidase, partial [Gammaproteobacteria bacterium]